MINRRPQRFIGARAAVARIAARQASRFIRSQARRFNRPQQKRNGARAASGGDNPLTTQHDFKVDYRRRRRTRRLRRRVRRAKRFTKNVVNAYVRTMQSPKQVAKLAYFTRTCNPNTSNYFAVMLHSADGEYDSDNPQADWREWFIEGSAQNRRGWDDLYDPNAAPLYPFVSERGRAIRCNSASMEVTIRNTGTTPAMLSVYRIVCRRDWPFVAQTVESIYEQGFKYAGRVTEHDQPVEYALPVGMWDTQMTPEQLTSTPFQSYLFSRIFQIYRRTKYQLSPGEEINLTLKSNRPKIVYMDKVRGRSFARQLTHGYFIDFQGVPELAQVQQEPPVFISRSTAAQLTIQKAVRYSLTMMPGKRPSTSYDTNDPDPAAVAAAQLGSVELPTPPATPD